VTHDQVEAMTLAVKIVVLRSGVVEQVGAPLELYDDPANMFVAGFIGSPRMNFLKARVEAAEAGRLTVSLLNQPQVRLTLPIASTALKSGDDVSLGIRPESFREAGQGDADLAVEVDVAEHLGNTSYVYAHVSRDERIIIEREDSRDATNKDSLTVGIAAADTFLFDHAGLRVK
jgi:lactose/L-arabinose transport system ATP-binding protein